MYVFDYTKVTQVYVLQLLDMCIGFEISSNCSTYYSTETMVILMNHVLRINSVEIVKIVRLIFKILSVSIYKAAVLTELEVIYGTYRRN